MPSLSLDAQTARGGLLATPATVLAHVFTAAELARLDQALAPVALEEWHDHTEVAGYPMRRRNPECLHLEARLDPEGFDWVYRRVWTLIGAVNERRYGFALTEPERLRYLVYRVGDQYHWHHDALPSLTRKLSLTIQLSDPATYTGGDLQIMPPVVTCPRDQGTGILFPAYVVHQVTPIRTGERRALVARITGPALR